MTTRLKSMVTKLSCTVHGEGISLVLNIIHLSPTFYIGGQLQIMTLLSRPHTSDVNGDSHNNVGILVSCVF